MEAPTLIALRREPGALTRSLTALVLRLALGLALLLYGVEKLVKLRQGAYPGGLVAGFEPTWLGQQMPRAVRLFAEALPYVEVVLGALLIAGFATTLAAFGAGLLLVGLLFGLLVLSGVSPEGPAQIPTHFVYVLTSAAVLWLSPVSSNLLSVDGLIFGWFWKPRSEGEFRREGEPSRRA